MEFSFPLQGINRALTDVDCQKCGSYYKRRKSNYLRIGNKTDNLFARNYCSLISLLDCKKYDSLLKLSI